MRKPTNLESEIIQESSAENFLICKEVKLNVDSKGEFTSRSNLSNIKVSPRGLDTNRSNIQQQTTPRKEYSTIQIN